jgi:hypothetical protein
MTDLFISYAREDEPRVRPLASALEQKGWSVFWDHRIPAGQTWRSYIGRNLDEARCVIAVWSQHSVNSRWVTEEADEGQKRGVLVPILFDSIEPPMGFRSVQAADLTDWQPPQPSQQFEQLIADIKALLKGAPIPPVKEIAVEPARHTHTTPSEPPLPPPGFSLRRLTYALLALVLIGGGGYWVHQRWFSVPPDRGQTEPSKGDQLVQPVRKRKAGTASPGESPVPPRLYSQGQLVIRGTWSCDLDAGAEASELGRADFWWEQVNTVNRNLAPVNGAGFFVLGLRDFESVGYDDLQQFPYSGEKVEANGVGSNRIPQGTVVAYRTKQGRFGKFKVEQYGYNLTIRWATFATK